MCLFRKAFLALILAVFAVLVSSCVAVPAIYAVGATERGELKPFVEVVDVSINKNVTVSTLRGAKVVSTAFNRDMETVAKSPSSQEKDINGIVAKETLRLLSVSRNTNTPSLETLRIDTFYVEGYFPPTAWNHYFDVSKEKKVSRWVAVIRKIVDVRLTLRKEDTVLLEARGLWAGNDEADEIAGARQLAREVANAVLKKLNSPASQRVSTTEAKKE